MTARTGKSERPNRAKGKPTIQSLGAELVALKKRFHNEAHEHDLHVVELSKREADLAVIFAAIAAPANLAMPDRARWVACRINSMRAIEADAAEIIRGRQQWLAEPGNAKVWSMLNSLLDAVDARKTTTTEVAVQESVEDIKRMRAFEEKHAKQEHVPIVPQIEHAMRQAAEGHYFVEAKDTPMKLPSLAEMNERLKAATVARQASDRDSKPVVGA